MPQLTIPPFDGRDVDHAHNSFSGSDETPPEILDPGEETYLIVRATTSGIKVSEDKFGRLVRTQSLRVTHSMPADAKAVAKVKAEIKRQQDEEIGQASLDAEIDGEEA
ncbi:MAG: hypothetical protein ABR616_09955 [Dermatophilaceae bacterium]